MGYLNFRIEGTFLRSKVARRVFSLFVLSAFVPITMLGLLSYGQVRSMVHELAQRQLAQVGSAHARVLYDRLLGAHFILNAQAEKIRDGRALGRTNRVALKQVFMRVYLVTHGAAAVQFGVPLDQGPPRIEPAAMPHLARGEVALLAQPRLAAGSAWLAIAINPAQPARGILMAELDPVYLWGEREEFPQQSEVCVLGANATLLYCSSARVGLAAVQSALRGELVRFDGDETWLSSASSLFLRPEFGVDDWTVVVLRPAGLALTMLSQVTQTFVGVTVLSLLLVMLLSVVQIRRTLVPLESLVEGTRRIAREEFDQPVQVERDDEFEQLARSFNSMASRLGSQIGALRALSEIDQDILSHLDMQQIIERVHARLLELLPRAVVGVLVLDSAPAQGDTACLWQKASAQLQQVQAPFEARNRADLASWRAGKWLDVDSPQAPGFVAMQSGLGVRHCLVLPIIWRDEVQGALLIGLADAKALPEELIAQARDLGNRVGVALAARTREAQLEYRAHHDDLTGLPNRALLRERLQQELAHARRDGHQLALLFLDLDRFKSVNDSMGHDAGDQLLRVAAERLGACVRECDTVARLGGDEFVVMLTGLSHPQQAAKLAEKILSLLAQAFQIDGNACFIGASIGIAVFPADGATAEKLLKQADIAMYRAKAAGRGRFLFAEERMDIEQRERAVMERELRQAIARKQLSVHYQPRFVLSDGRLCGAEALLRWQHPELGCVEPASFIPLAEEVGLIDEIGIWVLHQVCGQLAAWKQAGYAVGTVAVNVSGRQFKSDKLVSQVLQALESFGLAPCELQLEVTESVLIDNAERAIEVLGQISRTGVSIGLDDFGTGYSSLTYLRRLPVDAVKIDQSFVRDLTQDEDARSIGQAIINMAHALRKSVVAEGVETLEQANLLRAWGCDEAQGYYFGRPLPAASMQDLMSQATPPVDDAS